MKQKIFSAVLSAAMLLSLLSGCAGGLVNNVNDGTVLDLTPYLTPDIMPNLCAILEEHPEIRAAITQEDGKIYGLPSGEQMTTGHRRGYGRRLFHLLRPPVQHD